MSDGTRCVLIVSWPDGLAAPFVNLLAFFPTATRKHGGRSLEFDRPPACFAGDAEKACCEWQRGLLIKPAR